MGGAGGMVAHRIVPCLDIEETGVVKGVHFRNLRPMGDPKALAQRYQRQGADEIVLLKIDAHRGHPLSPEMLKVVSHDLSIPLTVGGGIGSVDQAEALLAAGADRISFNTLALVRPNVINEASRRFGRQAVVLAVDARRSPIGRVDVLSRGGTTLTGRQVVEWSAEGARRGAGEILLTSIDRDGTQSGFDLKLLRALRRKVQIPIMASGGARNASSFLAAFREGGADAALAAGIFHTGKTTVGAVKRYLAARGVEVRQ